MREAGVTFVTVGVFSWARIEPTPGERDLGWLDVVLDLMDDHDIAVDLATATASPPPWLAHADPEVLPVDAQGRRLGYGSRQTWCPSSPVYRRHALALVEDLAARYAGHPALAMWHVSNELGCHNAHCYCDVSAVAFRRWLRERYGSLEALNAAWGTAFWSQHYADWDEVQPPRISTAQLNPTQQLDFRRFSSDELLDQHRAERDVLRRLSPGVPVTTNFMVSSHIDAMDYWRWAPEQDVVSQDHYLDGRIEDPLTRAVAVRGLDPGPGRRDAVGADGALHQRGQLAARQLPEAARTDAAQQPAARRPGRRLGGLLPVARLAGRRREVPLRDASARRHRHPRVAGGGAARRGARPARRGGRHHRVTARVADAARLRVDVGGAARLAAARRPALPRPGPRPLPGAVGRGRHRRRAAPVADLPATRWCWPRRCTWSRTPTPPTWPDYVHRGGHLLLTYFSGIVDENDHVRPGGYPGAFRDLLGIRVEEFCPLPASTTVTLDGAPDGRTWPGDRGPVGGGPRARRSHGGAQLRRRTDGGPPRGDPARRPATGWRGTSRPARIPPRRPPCWPRCSTRPVSRPA